MKQQVLFNTLANLIPVACSWVILLYLIHFGNKVDIGMWGLLQAIALPIHLFFTFKLRVVQLVDNTLYTVNTYFFSRVLLAILSFILTIVYSFIFMDGNYLYPLMAIALSYSVAIIREYYISRYQLEEKNNYFLVSNTVSSLLSLLLFILFYNLKGMSEAIISFCVAKVIALIIDIYYERNIKYYVISDIDFVQIKNILKKGFPLGITIAINILMMSIPQILIEKYMGLEKLGIFVAITALLSMFSLFFNSFFQVYLPKLSQKKIIERNKEIKKIFYNLIFVLLLMDIVFYIFIDIFYYILLGENSLFYFKELILCLLVANVAVLFSFGNFLLNLEKMYKIQPYIYVFILFFILFFNVYIINFMNLELILLSLLFGNLIGFLLSVLFYLKKGVV